MIATQNGSPDILFSLSRLTWVTRRGDVLPIFMQSAVLYKRIRHFRECIIPPFKAEAT